RRNRGPQVGIEGLESRQMLSAVTASAPDTAAVHAAVPRAEQPIVFWDDFSPIQVTEGNSGSHTFALHIFSSPQAKKAIKISGQIEVSGSGAGFADGNDFKIEPFTATIPKGAASTTVNVTIFGDTLPEPDEVFQAVMTHVTNATISGGAATVTILNDDAVVDPTLPKVSIEAPTTSSATEGQTQTFTLQLDKVSATDVSVTVHLAGLLVGGAVGANAAATIPDDAQFEGGASDLVVTIPAGSLTQSFGVILVDDTIVEATEFYAVSITSATGAIPSGATSQTASIIDNDGPPAPPVVTIAAQTNTLEGNSGLTPVPITVSLDHVTDHDVTIQYSVEVHKVKGMSAKDRATKTKDFIATTGSVTIAAGETTATIPVQVVGDTKVEHNETFQVRLTSVNGGTLATTGSVGLVTILDDDGMPM
ncbi:MAG: Na-Ca exchanger/integrin-beta4, partial [Planctomycetaceae bacterium]|nr:Na-Ca exchanger/integrin-beta4 [Planctomycetaceae bacterium]